MTLIFSVVIVVYFNVKLVVIQNISVTILLFHCLEDTSHKPVDGVMRHGPHTRIKTTGCGHFI